MLAQEALREMMEMCTMHMSIIEQGINSMKLPSISHLPWFTIKDYEREESLKMQSLVMLVNSSMIP